MTTRKLTTLALLSVVLAFGLGAKECESKRIKHALVREVGMNLDNADFKKKYKTPGGVQVGSTVEVPADVLPLIDEGIRNQITRHNAAYPHWTKYRNLSDYKVLFVDPAGVSVETLPGAPFIHVKGWPSAGTCIGCVVFSSCRPNLYIVLPHQQAQEWRFRDYLMRSAWHESEHVREFPNDYNVFLQYAHAGDVHPHVP